MGNENGATEARNSVALACASTAAASIALNALKADGWLELRAFAAGTAEEAGAMVG